MYAENFTTFSFHRANGTVENVPAVGAKITFNGSILKAINAGASAEILLPTIDFMCFGDPNNAVSALANTLGSKVTLNTYDGTIQLTAPADMSVRVWNATGQLINECVSIGTQQNIAAQLMKGIYIVHVGSETFKTIVK